MDLYRPIYHFMPERNWMNDPNGLLFYQGEYHLFYQYNPHGADWGTIHWGHAKSKDLVHWERLPIALSPSTELGEEHCFSGSAVIDDNGTPTIFYTSIGSGERDYVAGAEQWMATSADGMATWTKYAGNPVLSKKLHGDMAIREWRDPFVWRGERQWLMVVGGQHRGKGCALIYGSADLVEWRLLNKLMEAQREEEYLWECPIFFPLADKYVLLYSPKDQVRYYTGTLNEDFTFTPERHGIVDCSGWEGFYAPNTLEDDRGRRIMWGWMTEMSRGDFPGGKGWSGALSLPRVLTLAADGRLRMAPAPELQRLRGEREQRAGLTLDGRARASQTIRLATEGRALEVMAEFEPTDAAAAFGIQLLHSARDEEYTLILFEPSRRRFTVDRTRSSLSPLPHRTELCSDMTWQPGETIQAHIFLDHSVLEVFVNEERCLSTRVYPTLEDSTGVTLRANGGQVTVKSLTVWKLRSIWGADQSLS